jgi:hypothetical protein
MKPSAAMLEPAMVAPVTFRNWRLDIWFMGFLCKEFISVAK